MRDLGERMLLLVWFVVVAVIGIGAGVLIGAGVARLVG